MTTTNTKTTLLETAANGMIEIQTGSYCGRSFGRRELAAANALVAEGRLALIATSDLITGRGNRHYYTTRTYRVVAEVR